jgi:hypothetical protein
MRKSNPMKKNITCKHCGKRMKGGLFGMKASEPVGAAVGGVNNENTEKGDSTQSTDKVDAVRQADGVAPGAAPGVAPGNATGAAKPWWKFWAGAKKSKKSNKPKNNKSKKSKK